MILQIVKTGDDVGTSYMRNNCRVWRKMLFNSTEEVRGP